MWLCEKTDILEEYVLTLREPLKKVQACVATYFPLYCWVAFEFLLRGINKGTAYLILTVKKNVTFSNPAPVVRASTDLKDSSNNLPQHVCKNHCMELTEFYLCNVTHSQGLLWKKRVKIYDL